MGREVSMHNERIGDESDEVDGTSGENGCSPPTEDGIYTRRRDGGGGLRLRWLDCIEMGIRKTELEGEDWRTVA